MTTFLTSLMHHQVFVIGSNENEYSALDYAIFAASLKAANVSFDTRLENAMRANDIDKAKEILAREFRSVGDTPVIHD